MNFKVLSLKLAMTAVTATSAACFSAPSQAATLGSGSFIYTSTARLEVNNQAGLLNFADNIGGYNSQTGLGNVVFAAPGAFESLMGTEITLKDLNLERTGRRRWELIAPVREFMTLSNGIRFRLQDFKLRRRAGRGWVIKYDGFFYDSNNKRIGGFGQSLVLRGLRSSEGASVYTALTTTGRNATSIPTPALLPGLLALGAGILRKQRAKDEAAEEQTNEPIQVEA